MKRRRLLFLTGLLLTTTTLAGLVFFGLTEQGFRQVVRIAVRAYPGGVTIENTGGRLFDSWQVEGLRVETPYFELNCKKIVARWQPPALLRGEVRIIALQGEGVDVRIKEEGMDDSPVILPDLLLPLGLALRSVEVRDLFIHGISGVDVPRFEQARLELTADRDRVHVRSLTARIDGASARVHGTIGLSGKWPLDLQGDIQGEQADVGAKDAGNGPVAADFVIGGTVMEIESQIDIKSPVQAKVHLSCSDLLNDPHWQADTALSGLHLREINPDWPEITLATVAVKVSGTSDVYQGTAAIEGAWVMPASTSNPQPAASPPVSIETAFSGDFSRLEVSARGRMTEESEEGAITLQAVIDHQEDWRWQAELAGEKINPQPFFADWPGLMNVKIVTHGTVRGDELHGEARLVSLDGSLRGYPLAGTGLVSIEGEEAEVQNLLLQSGDSELGVTGTIAKSLDLQIRFNSANLGNIWPAASGVAHFEADLQGEREAPKFSFTVDGSNISYQEKAVRVLTGLGQGVLTPQGEVEVKLEAQGLQSGGEPFSSLVVEVGGTLAHHQAQAKLTGMAGEAGADGAYLNDVEIVLGGGWEAGAWQGEVRTILLRLDPYGDWRLASPAPLKIAGEQGDLSPLCLEQGEARMCVDGGWKSSAANGGSGDSEWRLNAELQSLPCERLYQWHLLSHPLVGILGASIQTTGSGTRLTTGSARVSVPELRITVHDEDGREQSLQWTESLLTMELVDSHLVSMAKTRWKDGSVADATITVDQFGDLAASWDALPMQGEIGVDIKDLTTLAALTGYAVKPTGSMKGRFAVSGRVGNPRLAGELRQVNGNIFVPATGISLENALLSVMVQGEEEKMRLILEAASGPGTIRVAGVVMREEKGGWRMDATATGQAFEVAHLPDYEISVDPDLRLIARDGMVAVSGKVLIPKAVVVVHELDNSVSASSDVVFVDGKADGEKSGLPVTGTVNVELGPDVRVDAFGLKGLLQGGVLVSASPGHPLTGKGSLTVHEGIFVVRDRALEISRGRFSFLGGPLDNPGLDVQAQNKNKNKTVGVLASGTVNDMDLKLFSDPPMAESAILTELLAGRSYSGTQHQVSSAVGGVVSTVGLKRSGAFLENILVELEEQFSLGGIYMESGANFSNDNSSDVSVMIGRELFEDLYISYGYDPFNAAGIFKARYDLGKGFAVETEVGAGQTGADLLWSIDK
jgi:translocation and assembly module TamB